VKQLVFSRTEASVARVVIRMAEKNLNVKISWLSRDIGKSGCNV
jgi:hypothetical protein